MRKKNLMKISLSMLCVMLLSQGCGDTNNTQTSQTSVEKETQKIETQTDVSKFTEDWYKEYKYYQDSNGRFFELHEVTDTNKVEIEILGDYVFQFVANEYEVNGSKYTYKDNDMNATITYSPEDNHNIEIVLESETLSFENIAEGEYIATWQNYVEENLDFTEDWYKEYKYWWSLVDDEGFALDYIELEDGEEFFFINALQFNKSDYELDYENYAYVYESTSEDGSVYLHYYPNDNFIEIKSSEDEISYYDLISEDEYLTNTEVPTENNATDNKRTYSDAELYQFAYSCIGEALANSLYSDYYWEFVREAGISNYTGGGYTVTFYMYSPEMKSYKYLRIHIGVWANGLYYISAGM
ncbi:MAG: hypothetical protein IJO60_07250 [Agathobacter sp.]|nr:hypothetical protein [Agathobacter sp.]